MLIPSEQSQDLKNGLIYLTQAIRSPGWITVVVDNAKEFESLVKSNDKDLLDLKIELQLTDTFNKNANSVVDRGCQELEEELRKLCPEAETLLAATLSKAIVAVDQKLRRKGMFSAYEMHTARDLNTGENLSVNDDQLQSDQLNTRKDITQSEGGKPDQNHEKVGDTVTMNTKQDKHHARDMFIVTGTNDDKV